MDPLLGQKPSLSGEDDGGSIQNPTQKKADQSKGSDWDVPAISEMTDLRPPYGTRPSPVMEGAVLEDLLSDFQGSDSSKKQPQQATLDRQPLRASLLESLQRDGLTTIKSGRALLKSNEEEGNQDQYLSQTAPSTSTMSTTGSRPIFNAGSSRIPRSRSTDNSSSVTAMGEPSSVHRRGRVGRTISKTQLSGRSLLKSRFASQTGRNQPKNELTFVQEPTEPIRSCHVRRYNVGDMILINNEGQGWMRLLNIHGFPPGSGETVDERKGPYQFLLARVQQIHFDEVQPYYTVTVIQSGVERRGDGEYMHPILTAEGIEAAMLAATSAIDRVELEEQQGAKHQAELEKDGIFCHHFMLCLYFTIFPFLWLYDAGTSVARKHVLPMVRSTLDAVRRQASLMLNGKSPYMCPLRCTMVNFIVLCSVWYMFADMVRLAFLPPRMDKSISKIDLAVWIVLVLELFFQVFIRPDGFKELVLTDKAYSPTTIRYINWLHLYVELLALLVYVPEFLCVFSSSIDCQEANPFSFHQACLFGTIGPTRLETFYGHAYFALVRLRVFGLIRHWRSMWITNTFINMKWAGGNTAGLRALIPMKSHGSNDEKKSLLDRRETSEELDLRRKDEVLTSASTIGSALMATNSYRALGLFWGIFGVFPVIFCINSIYANPLGLRMTALLEETNILANDNLNETCHFLSGSVWSWVTAVAPPIGFQGDSANNYGDPYLLSVAITPERCPFQDGNTTLRVLCQRFGMTAAEDNSSDELRWPDDRVNSIRTLCSAWKKIWKVDTTPEQIADATNKRQGSILFYNSVNMSTLTRFLSDGTPVSSIETFSVTASFDATRSVELAASSCLLSQICLLFVILGGLSVLRRDAEILVLNPLRRMLKKVAQYAKNPLVQPRTHTKKTLVRFGSRGHSRSKSNDTISSSSSDSDSDGERELGSFETQQLITAVNKITDLLRKCWGVAGADIISTNLAAREGALEVFNPTVPGKSVYALFGFACINNFEHILMSLQDDVMILINDVAAVLHGEVFRWGFGDSGQCNKNLGAAFLMVFRIGLVKEVIEKLEQATDVIFSTSKGASVHPSLNRTRKTTSRLLATNSGATGGSAQALDSGRSVGSSSRDDISGDSSHGRMAKRTRALQRKKKKEVDPKTLSLQSLPGISTFTDRAVIGMLKAFAGIHRDNQIRNWNNDFRLSAGVGAFEVSMIFGMDAGWAVEGAVGSEYKIDATYLSPHVNMASRMMMASKQYGVIIMLSQAVQELMSDVAKTKLRHLDTVTVKGSSVKQRIYTYDARAQGVDFFLFSRTDEQADYDAEKYTQRIWETDQDLLSMRQHVSEKFLSVYNKGHKAYIQGDWEIALPLLEQANEIMVETALEEGYLEDQFEALQMMQSSDDAKAAEEDLKKLNGDGPSLYLVSFMKSLGGKAPEDWEGWHPLTRK